MSRTVEMRKKKIGIYMMTAKCSEFLRIEARKRSSTLIVIYFFTD